jgi:S1-C subfamily serine protease
MCGGAGWPPWNPAVSPPVSVEEGYSGRHAMKPLELTEAEAAPAYDAEEQNNIAVYKRVLPSVVNITSTTLVFNFFYGAVPQQGQGSGFVLDKAGHVLTNFHVVEGANRGIEVMLSNKRRYAAKVVGTDKVHDLALLQIDAPNLEPVTLADSSGSPWARRSTPSAIPLASAAP